MYEYDTYMDTPPIEHTISKTEIRSGFKIFFRLLAPYKKKMIIFSVLGVIVALCDALLPYLFGRFVDALTESNSSVFIFSAFVPMYLVVLAVWSLIQLIEIYAQDYIWRHSDNQGIKVYTDYIFQAVSHVIRLPLSFHKTNKIAEIFDKINLTANNVESVIAGFTLQLGPQLLTIVSVLGLAFFIHPPLGLLLLVTALLYLVVLIPGTQAMSPLQTKAYWASSETWGAMGDYLHNTRQIKEAVAEERVERDVYKRLKENMSTIWYRMSFIGADQSIKRQAIVLLSQFFILTYSVYAVSKGTLSIGELIAINSYAQMMFGPFEILGRVWKDVQNSFINLNETEKILALPEEVREPKNMVHLDVLRGDVSFEHVYFAYTEKQPILKDISFSVQQGEVVAFVGESGVGKTTLVDLLLGFHLPTQGSVHIDGVDLLQMNLDFLRSHIAIVSQDIILLNDTIYNNIAFGIEHATKEAVHDAAEKALATKFIHQFPDKWDQVVGDRGIKLSGGQRQRVAIARAILKNPNILILDEPTSALDAGTENEIHHSLEKIMHGKTTFIIAHRFSTVRNADRIIVLKEGRIVQSGSHDELKVVEGEYKRLYELQIGLHE